jgi:hypothetical protein
MYRTNLIRAHQYFSNRGETDFDLTVAELLILEQIANGHKWMSEIKHNCAINDYTMSKSVLRLSTGYASKTHGVPNWNKGLELLTKHRDGRYKFMSFTPKGLQVRDAIMDYAVKRTEQKDDTVAKRHLHNEVRKIENLIDKLKQDFINI